MSRHTIPFSRIFLSALLVLLLYLTGQAGAEARAALRRHPAETCKETPAPVVRYLPPASIKLRF